MNIAKENKKVCVIGIWHLGSVVSSCLADFGYTVIGVDKDFDRIKNLNKGIAPIFEPGLKELLKRNLKLKRLNYTTDVGCHLNRCRYVFITFDTPVNHKDEVDLSEIFATVKELSNYFKNNSVIIIMSQVPVGTCEKIKSMIKEKNPSLDFDVCYCPENLRLGSAIENFKKPERIIIGADNLYTLKKVEHFFSVINATKLTMNLKTAEMVKHALNVFLGTCISFGNEIGNLCDEVGADALKVVKALQSDERIGDKMPLSPGLAFSGGTLMRDLKALKNLSRGLNYKAHLINGIIKVNENQNRIIIKKLKKIYGSLKGKTIGILGLTYKPGTSTLRRSASLEIIKELAKNKAIVKAYDPKASGEEIKLNKEFKFYNQPYKVAKDSDALIILTEWPEFKELDFHRIKSIMKKPVIIDGKNMLNPAILIKKGFIYAGIGRGDTV